MKKLGWPTYLNEDEESLVISSAEIEGVRGLPFDCHGDAMQLQTVFKAFKFRCGDHDTLEKFSMMYFW